GVFAGDGLIGGGPSGGVTLTVAFSGSGAAKTVARSDHNHDADYYTEAELSGPGSGASVHWDNLTAVPTGLADGDDDVLGGLPCADGQVAKWNAGAGQWECAADIDTDTDSDTLGGLSCADGQIARWNGSAWVCDADLDTDTDSLGALSCAGGQVAKWNDTAGQWQCAADIDTDTDSDTLAGLSCTNGQIARWNGLAWVCGADLDTDTTYSAGTGLALSGEAFAISPTFRLPQTCGSGQIPSWDGAGWSCADPAAGGPGWSLTGNAGTVPGTNFLGTTDAQSLELRVNGLRALLLEPQAASPNFIAGYGGNSAGLDAVGVTVGGGGRDLAVNQAGGSYSTVAGGAGNTTEGYAATVGGGEGNSAADSRVTVGGGSANAAAGDYATIGGGQGNTSVATHATVGGGYENVVAQPYGTVSGGAANETNATFGAIGGGRYNTVSGAYGTIAGGGPSDPGNPTTSNNQVIDDYGAIGGGGDNTAGSDEDPVEPATFATVGGGQSNMAGAKYATVGGGVENQATGYGSNIDGGQSNVVSDTYATVSGGYLNQATATAATIAGGRSNVAGEQYASIGGGYSNEVTAAFGSIPGGYGNLVSGSFGFAAGRQAQAQHQGSFVWADSSVGTFSSTGKDQFLIQAAGGVGIGTNMATPTNTLSVGGNTNILGEGRLVARGLFTGTSDLYTYRRGIQNPSAIDAVGDYIYVTASSTNTLSIIDVSDPDNPTYVGHSTSGLDGPVDIQVLGGLAFIASEGNDSLVIMDISDSTGLEAIGSTDRNLARPQAVHVSGNHAYVASRGDETTGDYDGLTVFDISDPTEIIYRGFTSETLQGTSDVFVVGIYAYVTSRDNDSLTIFDITNPENESPYNIIATDVYSSASLLDGASTVQVRGSYAYVLAEDSSMLVVLDIRNPNNILYVGHNFTTLVRPVSLYLSGDFAYVAYAGESGTAFRSGLAVFDIANPADIQVLSVTDMSDDLPMPAKPVAIAGNGQHVFVANEWHDTVAVYDINHFRAPAVVAGSVQADTFDALGDARVSHNLSVGGGLNVGPGGALIEGQLAVASRDHSYILGDLSLGAAGRTFTGTQDIQEVYPTHQLDVHGDARFRVNEEHSLILSNPPVKGAYIDFTSNNFGTYYTPTARIEFSVPDPFTGTTHTTDVKIRTQAAPDDQVRTRMVIGEEIYFYNWSPELESRPTISLTKGGDVLPGVDDAYLLGDSSHRWQAVYAVEGTIQTSDGRFKENIVDLDAGLDEVGRLRPVTFNWIDRPEDGRHFGLVAQEVAEVLPEIVEGGQSGQPLGMNYAEVVPVLVNAIQEQQAQISELQQRLAELE
ncbi:MAG: tail fiber domain-containing protein, partial [Candidatus Promineifilaceae bacterium]